MSVMSNIGDLIIKLRTDFDITQDELAIAMGVSKPAVSQWEHGKGIKTNYIYDIAKFFDVTVDELCADKLDSETNDAYLERNYNLSIYDFEGPITKANINKLERYYHHVKLIKNSFIELLPKWAKDELSEDEMKEFDILGKYFKFDSNYYSYLNGGLGYIGFSKFSNTEKQFVLEIVDKCASLSNDERKWELSKIYYFDCDSEKKKQNEVHDSMMAEALKIMLSTFNQPMKDSLLMGNLTINEEYEVNTVFGKSKQERQKELTIQEIEQRSFFKTMLDSGCQCMLQIKQVPCISEEDTFEFLEGKVVEVPMKINDKLENNGLFINFGGYQQLDAIRNWKLYSLSEYKSMTDVSRTKYLKALVNYKYSNPSRYFESLRKYYEQDYLKEVDDIC